MQTSFLTRRGVRAALLAASLAAALGPAAHADRLPRTHALVGATIVVSPDEVIPSGTLVVRDGLIEAVGADLEPPADARIWDLEGLTLYPGLIESFHPRPWPEAGDDDPAPEGGHPNDLVRPERDVFLHPNHGGGLDKLRGAGFTTAVLVPKPGLFRGQSAVVNLGEPPLGDDLLIRGYAQNLRLTTREGFGSGYPTSTMGAVALVRQTLLDAAHHRAAQAAFADNPRQARPAYSTALDALGDAAAGRQPMVMESNDLVDSLRLAGLAAELSLDATLVGSGEEYQRLDTITAAGLPLIVPIDFPKAPDVGSEDDEDDLSVDLDTLRAWYWAPHNPRLLREAGVDFVLTSHGLSDASKLHEMAARAIDAGFDRGAVLAALTTGPAERLGLADRAGTLEAGKMANLVVADGELFTEGVTIRSVWVDGERYEVKEIEPPTVDPLGTWSVVVNAGDSSMTVQMTLTGSVAELDGTLDTPMGRLPLQDAYVSGDTVEISIDATPLGMSGTIGLSMSIDGDSASGPGTSPQGPFTFTAERTSRPESSPESLTAPFAERTQR